MSIEKFKVLDLKFNAEIKGNPFCDIDFYAIVKNKSDDTEMQIHGFYNGDSEFIIRLNFNEIGKYSYTTYSNIDDLDGKSGEIEVVEKTNDIIHGPLVVKKDAPNRVYHYDGTHHNLCGFECDWLFAISYDDKVEMTKTKRLIDELYKNNLNHVIMNVYAYGLEWPKDPRVLPEHDHADREDMFPFGGSNSNPDYTTLNVDFFKHLDNVIALLGEKNIISHLMIYVWNKKVNWPKVNSKWDDMYFEYVVKRYQAYPNIVWDVSKEALSYGYCDMNYIVERTVQLKKMDSYKRLVTVHDYQFCKTFPTLVDIISTQTWKYDIHATMAEIVKQYPDKPVFNLEHGGYEEGPYTVFTGSYTNAEVCLRRNYAIMFAGTYSCYYWQPISWSVTLMPWESAQAPHFEYYKYMTEFFAEQHFETLIPDDQLGQGGYYMKNADMSKILIYCPTGIYHATLPAKGLLDGKTCKYKCFNIFTGEYSEEKTANLRCAFKPDFKDDCIVIIDVD